MTLRICFRSYFNPAAKVGAYHQLWFEKRINYTVYFNKIKRLRKTNPFRF